jgi:3-dehydroquinate synthase
VREASGVGVLPLANGRWELTLVAGPQKARFLRALGNDFDSVNPYGGWLHGEDVAVGMAMAAEFSRRLGWLKLEDVMRIRSLIRSAGLPLAPPGGMTADIFLQHMQRDKKVKQGKIRLVLLKAIGDAVITDDYSPELLREFLYAATAPAP